MLDMKEYFVFEFKLPADSGSRCKVIANGDMPQSLCLKVVCAVYGVFAASNQMLDLS